MGLFSRSWFRAGAGIHLGFRVIGFKRTHEAEAF